MIAIRLVITCSFMKILRENPAKFVNYFQNVYKIDKFDELLMFIKNDINFKKKGDVFGRTSIFYAYIMTTHVTFTFKIMHFDNIRRQGIVMSVRTSIIFNERHDVRHDVRHNARS